MRDSGWISTGPNCAKSWAGISGMPVPVAGAAAAGAAACLAQVAEQIVLGDPALGPGAGHRGQVYVQLTCGPADTGAGVHPGEVPGRAGVP